MTEQDLLALTDLDACCRNISNVEGLQAARNLEGLNLSSNSLTNFPVLSALTNLKSLDLSFNEFTDFAPVVPAGGLPNLEILDFYNNQLTNFVLPNGFPNLTLLNLGFNALARCSLPDQLTNLDTLFLEGNRLTSLLVPSGLTRLTFLDLSANAFTTFSLQDDMTNLLSVFLFANQLTNVTLPANLRKLASLELDFNQLRKLDDAFSRVTFSTVHTAPLWPKQASLHQDAPPPVSRATEARSIDVIDDNDCLLEVYKIVLEAKGYQVRTFNDRAEALNAVAKNVRRPDLLVMDYLGHPMTVDWFIQRCLILRPTLRILMATGLGKADLRFPNSTKPDRFIQKPFTLDEFLREVEAALQ